MTHDVIIVGGGLAGSLAAWRLVGTHPELQLCLLEAQSGLGGNHTWSFHATDLSATVRRWIEPLTVAQWTRHEVRFVSRTRVLSGSYAAITSERLHAVVSNSLGGRLRLGTPVLRVERSSVTLADGETLSAPLVIDARGGGPGRIPFGWQTFVGQELTVHDDHGLRWPILMDATVPQEGGFRFVYVLPWTATRLLIEDTLYADTPGIDVADRRHRIASYAVQHGWRVREVVREEQGALPIPLAGDVEAFWPDDSLRIGVRAGLFHPTTGYSLPDAAATADLLAAANLRNSDAIYRALRGLSYRRWRERAFFRLLNRLLFRAAAPDSRVQVLDHFYRRPESLIARFYAGRLTWFDRGRLLTGRPPVPLIKALAHVRARAS
jgi:lycopene beta-cyclase